MSNFRYTRSESFPPVVKNLLIINILAFVAQQFFDQQYDMTRKLSLWPVNTSYFEPYQIFTHMFLHAGFMHLLFNMLMLWMIVRVLESYWGSKRFLFFYLVCGLGAAAAHLGVEYIQVNQQIAAGGPVEIGYALGASGAIMGLMAGFAWLFPNTEFMLIFFPVPIKAKYFVPGLMVLDILGAFSPVLDNGVAHFAHLGGALTGFIIVLIWNKTNRRTLY